MQYYDYGFPYKPYAIQLDFIRDLQQAYRTGAIAIMESPTGTGKTLSTICGSLHWLTTEGYKPIERPTDSSVPPEPQDFIAKFKRQKEEEERQRAFEEEQAKRRRLLARLQKLRQAKEEPAPKRKKVDDEDTNDYKFFCGMDCDEEELALGASRDKHAEGSADDGDGDSGDSGDGDGLSEDDICNLTERKVYFCSRTHSQLSQVVEEFRKTIFAEPSFDASVFTEGNKVFRYQPDFVGPLRVAVLASRQRLCIHPVIGKLKSPELINEKCTDLAQGKGCPFKAHESVRMLRDYILTHPLTVDEVRRAGERYMTCPYYAERKAVPLAQLVCLPYQFVLSSDIRKTLGLPIKDNVVIFDEAHHLADAAAESEGCRCDAAVVQKCGKQVEAYLQRYYAKAASQAKLQGRQCSSRAAPQQQGANVRLLESLLTCCEKLGAALGKVAQTTIYDVNAFLAFCELYSVDFFALSGFLDESDIVNKVSGYSYSVELKKFRELLKQKQAKREDQPVYTSPLSVLRLLVKCLARPALTGRVVVVKEGDRTSVTYLLLDPRDAFRSATCEARAIALVGGTITPLDAFQELTLDQSDIENPRPLVVHTSRHVIPPEQLLVLPIPSYDGGGTPFEFVQSKLSHVEMFDQLGKMLLRLADLVKGGIIFFFQSRSVLNRVTARWTSTGLTATLTAKTRLFTEPAHPNAVPTMLADYRDAVASHGSAVLLCPCGGRLSEGISFKDDLARCVCMCGLPYPNIGDVVLNEKRRFIKEGICVRDTAVAEKFRRKANDYFEDICMNTLNQAIGRSIRHRGDYSAILLADTRFQRDTVLGKLPLWMQPSVGKARAFTACVPLLERFFAARASSTGEDVGRAERTGLHG